MPTEASKLFSTVPQDHLGLFEGGALRYKAVHEFLGFKTKDVAKAASVPAGSVRFDAKMPAELVERVREWAVIINLVAGFFDGNRDKTHLWFTVPNPLLGGVNPRQMIRLGRSSKLFRLVNQALAENQEPEDNISVTASPNPS